MKHRDRKEGIIEGQFCSSNRLKEKLLRWDESLVEFIQSLSLMLF